MRYVSLFITFLSIVVLFGQDAFSASKISGTLYLDGAPVTIEINGEKITRISRDESGNTTSELYIAPGLIDNQINGYMQVAFAGDGLTVDGVRKATKALWEAGVTTYLPTLTTNSYELLLNNFKALAQARKDPILQLSIPGYFLEGPYISPIDGYRGAHLLEFVRKPDWDEFMRFYAAADEKILQVSLAPELEGAIEFIEKCSKKGILVGLAHHNGSAEQIKMAADAGAVVSTHLGNGCANLINRHDNPLWPQLAEDRLYASIICDGFHLRPEEVKTFWKAKGTDKILLTSDVTSLAGMPPGEYTTRGRSVVLTPDGKIMLPSQNVLAGAASPITKGIGNIMKFTNCTLADAIHMASKNQAQVYNLTDRGEIVVGKRADLIVFKMVDGAVQIQKTILAGKVVYEAN
jgi:N-acetylglucosamine-6-phosphate deacetylase